MIVLSFKHYQLASEKLANTLNCPFGLIDVHRFPDGESRVTIPESPPHTVILCLSLHQPNDKLVELMLACETLRKKGTQRIILIAPYLCYMRQDKEFEPGQAVSQKIIGRFLAQLVDDIITVDPHLHRVSSLSEAVPLASAHTLSAAGLMGEYLSTIIPDALLVGPDGESEQWVQQVAQGHQFDYVVATKVRYGDRDVRITFPDFSYQGRQVVLVDDVISSGTTLALAARQLKVLGCGQISAICTHALLAPGAQELLTESGIENLWSTDSIPHQSNVIELAGLLAKPVRKLLASPV